MLIDTHAHVNFKSFKGDSGEVIKRSLDNGIQVINVGSQFSTSERAVKLAEEYESGVYAAIGLHPDHLKQQEFEEEGIKVKTRVEKFDPEKYEKLAKSRKVVAIGEIGLDYYHGEENKEEQAAVFKEEIKLAVSLNLPIAVHCRNAYKDLLEMLIGEKKRYGEKLKGVIHSYLGRLSYAEEFNKLGFLIAFNGIITYARDYDKVIKGVDLRSMLLETDCPWLTPFPYRGKRNEPAFVKYIADKIAEIKQIAFDKVAEATTQNAQKLFGIKS